MAAIVRLLLLLGALAAVVAGCGGSSPSTTAPASVATATNPVARAPDAPQPPPDATQPGTGPITTDDNGVTVSSTTAKPTTTPSSGAANGGSEPVRTPAAFTIKGGKLVPPGITVPPFIAIHVTVVGTDGAAHKLVLQVPPAARTLTIPPHGRASLRLAGLRAGSYGITLDGRVAGGIVVGGDGGP